MIKILIVPVVLKDCSGKWVTRDADVNLDKVMYVRQDTEIPDSKCHIFMENDESLTVDLPLSRVTEMLLEMNR